MAVVRVTRAQVIAYRIAAQGLLRDGAPAPSKLAVLDIGVQDAMTHSARLAFDARLPAPPPADLFGPGKPLALTWSLRGAPYVHRRRDLDAIAAALYPLSEQDATARLTETGPSIAKAGIPALEQFRLAVDAMRTVVSKPIGKGAASTAVTKRIPEPMWRNCRVCKTHHISDSAMRTAALAAGLEMEPGTNPPVLLPRPTAKLPQGPDPKALRRFVLAYLAVLGPATDGDVADYYDVRRADLASAHVLQPGDLVEVSVDGRAASMPADRVEALRRARQVDVVRLLGPFDPWVQARDRDLIVPDRSVHKALWPVLGRPGVLLVDGEVLGTWRTKSSGAKLVITVDSFAPLPPATWDAIEDEAQRVGTVRGAARVDVVRA